MSNDRKSPISAKSGDEKVNRNTRLEEYARSIGDFEFFDAKLRSDPDV